MEQKKRTKIQFVFVISFVLFYFFIFVVNAQVVGDTFQVINLAERARNFFIEATKGNIIGQSTSNQFGQNLVVGTTEEDIQSQGGTLVFLESAEFISIVSSDTVNDILTGANATSVLIQGLDSDFIAIEEIVDLSSTSTNTTNQYIRVNKMEVNEVGNYTTSNAGIITGTAAVSGTVQIEIPIGAGKSKTTHFTVPAGQNLIITTFRVTMDTGKTIDIIAKIRENADDVTRPMSPVITIRDLKGLDTPTSGVSLGNFKFNEKTDIWIVGVTSVGTSSIEVNYDFVLYAIGS